MINHNTDRIWSFTVLPNGYLASGSKDIINIWNADTGILILTLSGNLDEVRSLAVLEDGDLASGLRNRMIKIWF